MSRPSFRIFLSWSSTAVGRCSSLKESFRATESRSVCSSAAMFGFRMGSKAPKKRGVVRKKIVTPKGSFGGRYHQNRE